MKNKIYSEGSGNCFMNRRSFLIGSAQLAVGLMLPFSAGASSGKVRKLNFFHTHTGERMNIEYAPGRYNGSIRMALEYFLRDFRTGDIHPIDCRLFDVLCSLQDCCGRKGTYEIISGFRSAKTNAELRKHTWGVAKKSLHMQGRAIDIRLTSIPTDELRDIALHVHDGGVGYYPESDFVHIDTGVKRSW